MPRQSLSEPREPVFQDEPAGSPRPTPPRALQALPWRRRCLKGNLLNARDRLGASIIEIVAADFAVHGPGVIEQLRQKNVVAYARLVSDLVHFKKLAPQKNPDKPRREPRQVRLKALVQQMAEEDDGPIDAACPVLSGKHRERWLEATEALMPRSPWNLTPDELRTAWGDDLAAWFETNHRTGSPRRGRRSSRWGLSSWTLRLTQTRALASQATLTVRFHLRAGRPLKLAAFMRRHCNEAEPASRDREGSE